MHRTLGGNTLKRITKAALGGVASCALILGGTGVASGELELLDFLKVHRDSNDVNTSYATLDAAKAKITIDKGTDSEGRKNTTFSIRITGIGPAAVDKTLGSHLHTGPCIANDGTSAGPHYNHQAALGDTTPDVNRDTEVWFDLVADEEGMAMDVTTVPFVPIDSELTDIITKSPGVMSVVVHVDPTNSDPLAGTVGSAGARQACFPLSVPQWDD